MHKVDSSGATAQNEFTDGDTQLQIARTRLEAKFMNTVQRELMAVIQQSGRVLSDADDAQLSKSLALWVSGTAAAVRSLPIPPGPVLILVSNVMGLAYIWEAASAAVDDGVTVLRPDSNPATGRWLRYRFSDQLIIDFPWSRLSEVPSTFEPETQSGTFVGTLNGCTTAPTWTFQYRRTGNIVTLWMVMDEGDAILGTSNTYEMSISGIPLALRPPASNGGNQLSAVPVVVDNGSHFLGDVFGAVGVIDFPNDQISFQRNGTYQYAANSGLKGIRYPGFSITYGLG